ncbi:MAG: AAA family ATPase [Oscillospiraceae bacterium]|jgi:RecA-family ATPase|nr:AAA family ATPase [Oscillospiraceae bacterium]
MLDITEALQALDPAKLDYNDWLYVGMALKAEGFTCTDWEVWSAGDSKRYHVGECAAKWDSFQQTGITAGTLFNMAQAHGWSPTHCDDVALDWDALLDVDGPPPGAIVDPRWLEDLELDAPAADWNPAANIATYLQTLFEPQEYVGYVMQSFEKDGRFAPGSKGSYTRTARELLDALAHYCGDLGAALGDYNQAAGAWIRFNPLDGKGVKNENVTAFRYTLVESDKCDIARQNAILRKLELPIAALVHSGNKSLHAIVRIDAKDYDEYRKRVNYVYGVCKKNGLEIDAQNRNPSRLSRLPGVTRSERRQYLLDTNIGRASYAEWIDWYEGETDDLPDPGSLSDLIDNLPALAPPLIQNVLRQKNKMLFTGPSKAGKSCGLMELSIAVAEGRTWLGWDCVQGKVLYVNLELDRASCFHRFADIYTVLGWEKRHVDNIHIWNLRGYSCPLDQLAPKLIRRAKKEGYIAVILDPVYKILTGDENSASDMAKFCNQLDRLSNELGCAVIYCHHHSKGAQSGKRAMDRASGSGVFARDADVLIDMIELELPEEDGAKTAWRVEGTLREFPSFKPFHVWFDYPLHKVDSNGELDGVCPEGETPGPRWQKAKEKQDVERSVKRKELAEAISLANFGEPPTTQQLAEYLGCTRKSAASRVNGSRGWFIEKDTGLIHPQTV